MVPAKLAGAGIRHMVSESTGMSIPTIYARGMVFTAWEPSPEELQALEQGGLLWLCQRGSYIPEMSMLVGHQEDVIPRDMMIEAAQDLSPDRQRMMEELMERKATIEGRGLLRTQMVLLILTLIGSVWLGLYLGHLLWK